MSDLPFKLTSPYSKGTSRQKVIVLVLLKPSIKLLLIGLRDFAAEIRRLKRVVSSSSV